MNFFDEYDFDFSKATLIVKSSSINFKCTMPAEAFRTYNNYMTLNLNKQSIMMGEYPWRTPCLIILRLTFTLLIEGFIFYLFGYREKRSWLLFLIINLITQGFLNYVFSGSHVNVAYAIYSYYFIEFFVIISELVAFGHLLKEHTRSKTVMYVLCANFISLILGAWILMTLPI